MPVILTVTIKNGDPVPMGWKLVRNLRGRSIYTYYSETHMPLTSGLHVQSKAEAMDIENTIISSADDELTHLLGKMNITL
jgi:hypothetical protein